jgi:hypothetical protein
MRWTTPGQKTGKAQPVLSSPVGLYVVDGAEALSKDLESRFSCITILLLLPFVSQLLRLYPQRKACTTRPSPLLSALDSSLLSNLTIDAQTKIHSFKKGKPTLPLASTIPPPNPEYEDMTRAELPGAVSCSIIASRVRRRRRNR